MKSPFCHAAPARLLRRLTAAPAWAWLALTTLLAAGAVAAAPLSVLVNPGDIGEQSRHASYQVLNAALGEALREVRAGDVQSQMSTDAAADLSGTRAQTHDIYIAPAYVVGSALRNGYVPLAGNAKALQAVLVTLGDSSIADLRQAAGKRLGLPMQDSVVSDLVRGELSAANASKRTHFRSVKNMRYQDALLVCLKIRECELVGVERAVLERWKAAGENLNAFLESRPVPGIAVAVKQSLLSNPALKGLQPALLRAMSSPAVSRSGVDKPAAIDKREFEYVSTLGYFTPRNLPGATVVDAPAVAKLMGEGAI